MERRPAPGSRPVLAARPRLHAAAGRIRDGLQGLAGFSAGLLGARCADRLGIRGVLLLTTAMRAVGHLLLSLAVGLGGAHGLTHDVKKPGGWKNLGTYNRYQAGEFGRFAQRLKDTPEPMLGTAQRLARRVRLLGRTVALDKSFAAQPVI